MDLEASDEAGLTWSAVTTQYTGWLRVLRSSLSSVKTRSCTAAKIQRSGGQYGGLGIDEIIYKEIGGVELQITGGELQN